MNYTVKLTRAKLPANAGNFTCGLHVKRPHTQFVCVTCSLLVKKVQFTRVYATSTSLRIHANGLQPHVSLPDHSGYLTGNFISGTHANSPAIAMQNCLHSLAKKPATSGKTTRHSIQKYSQSQAKIPSTAGKNTCNRRRKYPQLQAKIRSIALEIIRNCRQYCYHTAGKITGQLLVS